MMLVLMMVTMSGLRSRSELMFALDSSTTTRTRPRRCDRYDDDDDLGNKDGDDFNEVGEARLREMVAW